MGDIKLQTAVLTMEKYLRLRTFPVGIKFLADLENVPQKVRRPQGKTTLCQQLTTARTYGWTIMMTAEELFPVCANIYGMKETAPQVADGTFRSLVWCANQDDGRIYEAAVPKMPAGEVAAVLLGPLSRFEDVPDTVVIYGSPAQVIMLVNALQFEDYEPVQGWCVGESSCADSIVRSMLTKKPALGLPCFGERRYGHTQDDEMVIGIPGDLIDKVARNLGELYKRGVRFPIPYLGTQSDPLTGMPDAYLKLFKE